MSTMSWVTYTELAAARAIGRAAAIRMVQRNRWQRRPLDDGSNLVQVRVPKDRLEPLGAPVQPGDLAALRREMALLRRDVAMLKDRLPAR